MRIRTFYAVVMISALVYCALLLIVSNYCSSHSFKPADLVHRWKQIRTEEQINPGTKRFPGFFKHVSTADRHLADETTSSAQCGYEVCSVTSCQSVTVVIYDSAASLLIHFASVQYCLSC